MPDFSRPASVNPARMAGFLAGTRRNNRPCFFIDELDTLFSAPSQSSEEAITR
jgi:hypothetical protein